MSLPEIILNVESDEIFAKTRTLKANWSMESQQDVRAMHNIDAAQQLSDIMAAELAAEIDREILNDLRNNASGGAPAHHHVPQWSTPGTGVGLPSPSSTPSKKKQKQYRSIDDPWDV
jgi:hypothetical protein